MQFSNIKLSRIPVWIKLHHAIPLEYWTNKRLSYITSALGVPLHANNMQTPKLCKSLC
jgi:hypothetical protein